MNITFAIELCPHWHGKRRTPQGRGNGYPESGHNWVDYEPVATGTAVAFSDDRQIVEERPRVRYKMVSCSECGLQLPQNEAHRVTEEVEVARTSGTFRTTSSRSSRYGTHNSWSNTSRQGYASERTYYKNGNKLLCENCFAAKQQRDAEEEAELNGMLMILGTVVLAIIIAAAWAAVTSATNPTG